MIGLINDLEELLIDEKNARLTDNAKLEKQILREILINVRAIGATNDVNLILTSEKVINNFHLKYYSNSKPMESSLNETINNLKATEILLDIMQHNPNEYKIIAKGFTQSKNVSAGLPLDEARQYFRAQKTRFINMSKVDLSDEKKEIIEIRKSNIRHASNIYAQLQGVILAIDSKKLHITGVQYGK